MIQPYIPPPCEHKSRGTFESEHVWAEIKNGQLDIYIGGTDYYADQGEMQIKFCPFCGVKVEDIRE